MLIVILPLIISPFLTYYISTVLFYRKANSKASGKTPPTVPFFIPGIFHAFTLAYEGPQRYFAALMYITFLSYLSAILLTDSSKQYGSFSPFAVKAGPTSFVVLKDPKHVERVLRAQKQLTSRISNYHMYENLYGSPKETLKFYSCKGLQEKEAGLFDIVHSTLSRKYLAGTLLAPLIDVYVSILSRNLNEKMFQVGSWTQIEDFWSFFQQVICRCAIETLLGSAIFKQYPGIIKDYLKFAEASAGFLPGMPRFLTSAAYEGPRDRLQEGIMKWLKANHSGSEFAKIGDEDPVWDEFKGSKFIQERDDVFLKTEGVDLKARATEILSVMHSSSSNLLPSAFWTIVEVLRQPQLGKHLTAEISQQYLPQSKEYDVTSIMNTPLIQSIHTEVRRLRVNTVTARTNEVDAFKLDEQWSLPKGTTVILFSQDVSLHPKFWAKARSPTAERPLEEFWAERFLIANRAIPSSKKEKQTKDKVETGSFSMEGLEPVELVLDDNDGLSLGHEYMKAMQAATLAVFLTEFEIQLCDSDAVDAAVPPVREAAYGTVKPLDDVAVRIRKRKMG
ncbi:Nn.00g001750.m01.CDS01 [Neocucurbitaria sp. VM-36]